MGVEPPRGFKDGTAERRYTMNVLAKPYFLKLGKQDVCRLVSVVDVARSSRRPTRAKNVVFTEPATRNVVDFSGVVVRKRQYRPA